ncbi:hypothetical protein BH09BAC1_BH09BAC1_00590 [soil metagenome]
MATQASNQNKRGQNQNQNLKNQKAGKQQQSNRTGLQGKLGTKTRDMG